MLRHEGMKFMKNYSIIVGGIFSAVFTSIVSVIFDLDKDGYGKAIFFSCWGVFSIIVFIFDSLKEKNYIQHQKKLNLKQIIQKKAKSLL